MVCVLITEEECKELMNFQLAEVRAAERATLKTATGTSKGKWLGCGGTIITSGDWFYADAGYVNYNGEPEYRYT